ncbi:FapA family protein [Bacillus solitudinis]|uniref:FapA family protein n=1 Tax=Bacillus solitudinis TaxID=2014074 RepID=UPI000C24E1ED|nr:FapA family protein [Bacillus solitudinis]
MQSIVSKGRDINEAILLGLDLMETTRKNVNIEIIQQDTKGFLGVFSKEAIVKLTKLEASTPREEANSKTDSFDIAEQLVMSIVDEETERVTTSKDQELENTNANNHETLSLEGKVWVKNGQICYQSSEDQYPLVTISEDIEVLKNNQIVKEKTFIISEKDFLEVKVENEKIDTKWKTTVDRDKLQVILHVEPGYNLIHEIPDIEPEHHIKLVVEEKKELHNSLNYESVIEQLERLSVTKGYYNHDQIMKAIETKESGAFEIATGIKPNPGKDGWIELKVDIEGEEGLKEDEKGLIDFREIQTIPNVKRGEVIAIVHPPIPGEAGYTVTNEVLPAKQTFAIVLRAGIGATIIDNMVVATESGRPQLEKRGQLIKVTVIPKLIHPGNVDLSSGNLRFMGDIEIIGGVEEKMVVVAEGDIIVHKTVYNGSLTSSGSIITSGNIISSDLSAGKNNILVAELGQLLGILHQQSENMIAVIQQLTKASAFKDNDLAKGGLQPLIRILIEKKFKSFPVLAKKYVDAVRKGGDSVDKDWKEIAVLLTQLFLLLTKEATSLERIIHLSDKMKELHEISKTPIEPNSFIRIPNALNSTLYSSGDVMITEDGCVNTKVHAGGLLNIIGTIRGGEVYGKAGVEINEAGSEIGTHTVIAVPSDQKIKINKAMEGTSIKIGNVKYTFKETRYLVRAHLDEKEQIVLD